MKAAKELNSKIITNQIPTKMSKSTKSFLYNFIGFAIIFFATKFFVGYFTNLTGLWVSGCAFGVGTLLAPKFQTIKTADGEKLFMKWLFIKGLKKFNNY